MIRAFRGKSGRNQHGHGLAEYCLAAAFISLLALGLYLRISGGVHDLWSTANSTLVNGTHSGQTGETIGHAPR